MRVSTFLCVIQFGLLISFCRGTTTDAAGDVAPDTVPVEGVVGAGKTAETHQSISLPPPLNKNSPGSELVSEQRDSNQPPPYPRGRAEESRGSYPDHASIYTGTTKKGQRVTVRKWYVSHDGEPYNGTDRASSTATRRSSTRDSSVLGSSTRGSSALGSSTRGSSVLGSSTRGSSVLGSSTRGSSALGSSTRGSSALGSSTRGSSALGSSTRGSTVLGSSTRGSSVLGSSTRGSSVLGSSTRGSSVLGSSTRGSSALGSTSRSTSTQRSGVHRNAYSGGRYTTRGGGRIRSGASSTIARRRSSRPTRRGGIRTYVPRSRLPPKGRQLPPVYNGPIDKSRTYVYPFTERTYKPSNSNPDSSALRRRIATDRNRGRDSRRPSAYTPVHQNTFSRGNETQALSSNTDAHHHQQQWQQQQHRQQQRQYQQRTVPSRGESPNVSQYANPQRRQTHYASNSSVTSSLNRRRGSSGRVWGRVNDPSRFNPRANPRRTPGIPGTTKTGSVARARSGLGTATQPQYLDNTRGPQSRRVNSHSPHLSGRRTRYPSNPTVGLRPTVQQRTFRRNQVSPGYYRNAGQHSQRSYYARSSTGSIFTSYDVVDDGECPNTGIDLRINGLDCQQAVQNYGQYLCYVHEYTSKQCCETCLPRKRSEKAGCEYGDHARLCSNISPSDCYDRRNELSCCETCARFKKAGAPEMCQWGDMIGTQRCEEVRRNPGLCYVPDNARLCCETCNLVKNITNPTCPWGDQNARMCQIFGQAGEVLINCYSPYRRRLCCQACERLKEWLPESMPNDCEYGDRPVVFNTGQYGRVNCAQILKYVSVDECRNNSVVSRNCCYTCQRYLNSTSTFF